MSASLTSDDGSDGPVRPAPAADRNDESRETNATSKQKGRRPPHAAQVRNPSPSLTQRRSQPLAIGIDLHRILNPFSNTTATYHTTTTGSSFNFFFPLVDDASSILKGNRIAIRSEKKELLSRRLAGSTTATDYIVNPRRHIYIHQGRRPAYGRY